MFDILMAAVIAMRHPTQSPIDSTTTACEFEDGTTDGTACVWTDPDTGTRYDVDSSNHR